MTLHGRHLIRATKRSSNDLQAAPRDAIACSGPRFYLAQRDRERSRTHDAAEIAALPSLCLPKPDAPSRRSPPSRGTVCDVPRRFSINICHERASWQKMPSQNLKRTSCKQNLQNGLQNNKGQLSLSSGAPEEIRTPDPQIRSFRALVSHGFSQFRFGMRCCHL